MFRLPQQLLLALAIAGAPYYASAFALLGPVDATWQTTAIGYNPRGFDIGGPMVLGEEYRWDITTITYGFDPSFVDYFGQKGVQEVNKAIAILNNLGPMSKLSVNLTEFPTDTRRLNYNAMALNLIDLKSAALSYLLEEMGLASPERYTWTLRNRTALVPTTAGFQYLVIQRNFDPVTLAPSAYVNGTLYTYSIIDPVPAPPGVAPYADAEEAPLDPDDFGFTAVVSAVDNTEGGFSLGAGQFFTGLTRDDVGGLRYLYAGKGPRANLNIETLPAGAAAIAPGVAGGSPWAPAGSGGALPVGTALRPGVDKILFRQAQFDSGFGFFISVTNSYKDTYVTNSHRFTQRIVRVVTQPDILFRATDLGLTGDGFPISSTRSTSWHNNSALYVGSGLTAGPGQVQPPVVIAFSTLGPFFFNRTPTFLGQADQVLPGDRWVWGSFDGTTNAPTVYPSSLSIEDLMQQVLSGQ